MQSKELLDELLEYSPSLIEARRLYSILEQLDDETQERISNQFVDAIEFINDQMEFV